MSHVEEHGWVIEGASLAEVMGAALRHLSTRENGAGKGEPALRLVFSGEGTTPEDALHAAMDDIREQCLDQRATPVEVETSGVMATDAGTRIWGTVAASAGTSEIARPESEPTITIRQGEGERWTLTIA